MAVKQRRQLTDEERAERRERDREYARKAVEQLRSSEGWKAWLTARASFDGHSLGNQLLIAMQRPRATRVAGFQAWLRLGYCVSRGETAIRIWAPCPPTRKQLEKWRQSGGDPDQRPRTFFKLAAVFDRLSRVRSGDVADARVGLRFPAGISLLVCAPGFMREGTGFRLARASRRYPANRRVISRRECRHRVPKPGS
jgi:hypothetical protein